MNEKEIVKLIERNCESLEESAKNGIIAHKVDVDGFISDLTLLATMKIMEWISVKTKLPENDKMVLCFLENCNIRMMHYMGDKKFAEPWQGGIHKVKHWMELPEPPK